MLGEKISYELAKDFSVVFTEECKWHIGTPVDVSWFFFLLASSEKMSLCQFL